MKRTRPLIQTEAGFFKYGRSELQRQDATETEISAGADQVLPVNSGTKLLP